MAAALMEACWLLAIATVPLFFNSFSSLSFEPDKAALLRGIAVVAVSAWLIESVALKRVTVHRWRTLLSGAMRQPLIVAAAVFCGVYLIATGTSILPSMSWQGSYVRAQGTQTILSYVAVFAVMAGHVRAPRQVTRIMQAFVLTGTIVGLYALVQWAGGDPHAEATIDGRVESTLGHPIFLGGYLLMTLPFTLVRVVESFGEAWATRFTKAASVGWLLLYSLTLLVQTLAFVATGSRGPLLGLAMGAVTFAVLWLGRTRPKWAAFAFGSVVVAVLVGFLALSFPVAGLNHGEDPASRLGQALGGRSATARTRELLWNATVDLLLSGHAPPGAPGVNLPAALRPLIGYGPETFEMAFYQVYPPELAHYERGTIWDRPHNETLNMLESVGGVGALAYLALFAAGLYCALGCLHAIRNGADRRLYGISLACAATAVGLGAGVAFGWAFVPAAAAGGVALGAVAYAAVKAWRTGAWGGSRATVPASAATAAASALAGNLVELQSGIAVTATWLMFWACLGLLAALSGTPFTAGPDHADRPLAPDSPALATEGTNGGLSDGVAAAFLSSAVVITLLYDFLRIDAIPSLAVLTLILVAWLLTPRLFSANGPSWLRALPAAAAVSALFLAAHLWKLRSAQEGVLSNVQRLADLISGATQLVSVYYAALLFLALAAGVIGARAIQAVPGRSLVRALTGLMLLAVAGAIVYWSSLRPVRADMLVKEVTQLDGQAQYAGAAALMERTIRLAGSQDAYQAQLGREYLEAAKRAPDSDHVKNLQRALTALQKAIEINPVHPTYAADLARYWTYAALAGPASERASGLDSADRAYARALELSPHSAALWDEWGAFDLEDRRLPEATYVRLQEAVALDPELPSASIHMGDYWMARAAGDAAPPDRFADYRNAVHWYGLGIAQQATGSALDAIQLHARLQLAAAERALGNANDAIRWYADILQHSSDEAAQWSANYGLAQVYLQLGNRAQALQYAQRALAQAPESAKPAITGLLAALR